MKRIIIDVREHFEYKMGHVKEAVNIPVMEFLIGIPNKLASIPKDTEIIVYCHSGSRASMVLPYLQKYGFTNVTNGINRKNVDSIVS